MIEIGIGFLVVTVTAWMALSATVVGTRKPSRKWWYWVATFPVWVGVVVLILLGLYGVGSFYLWMGALYG